MTGWVGCMFWSCIPSFADDKLRIGHQFFSHKGNKYSWPPSNLQQITIVLAINLAFCLVWSKCIISSRRQKCYFKKLFEISQRGIPAGFTQYSFTSIPTLITNEPPCLMLFYGATLSFSAAIRKLLIWKNHGRCHEKNHGRMSSFWNHCSKLQWRLMGSVSLSHPNTEEQG